MCCSLVCVHVCVCVFVRAHVCACVHTCEFACPCAVMRYTGRCEQQINILPDSHQLLFNLLLFHFVKANMVCSCPSRVLPSLKLYLIA